MSLEPGTKLGSYEILSPIGNGTGIEVYKATDTVASRTVAIQVIPPQWAGGDEFASKKEQFSRATQAVGSLNHPHIRALHEIAQQDGVDFLVLEYLEGQTLAERLNGKRLPLDEALTIAIAIAGALEKAHGAGVVHRELNPANVMLTKGGVKLLDFGFAELRPASASSSVPKTVTAVEPARKAEESPNLRYTAPELFEGKIADARADLFAFGAILYEMVTGKKAFDGRSRAVLIAAITTAEPEPLLQLQPKAPRMLAHVIERCLAKDPADRWQTAHDLQVQLRWIAEGGGQGGTAPAARSELLVWAALAAAVLLMAGLAFPAARYLRGAGEPQALQFRVPVAGLSDPDIAIAPDGQTIALVVRPNVAEPPALYVRRMGSVAFLRLGGTEDATQPFWSPDSRYIAFVAGGRLKNVNVAGGAPKDISEAQKFYGGAWNREGTILFGSAKGLFRVSAEGGKPAEVTTLAAEETGHFWPVFLPDGHHFLYLAWSAQAGNRAVFAGSLDSKEKTKLMAASSNAAYAAPGYVLFHRDASLFAQPFDPGKRTLTGEPAHVADEVASTPTNGRGHFDVSQNGSLLYFQGLNATAGRGRTLNTQFGWVNRNGTRGQPVGEGGTYGDMDLSPDGKLIAVTQQDQSAAGSDVWVIDWQRAGVATRLTLDPADDVDPVWSPDGTRVAFTTYRKGNADIYVKNANNVGAETPLLESGNDEIVKDWSKDGRYIAYLSGQEKSQDIYVLPLSDGGKPGAEKPFPVVQGKFQKSEPQFSYDGKWLAYTSDETGTFQVTVMSFPAGDQKLQVSRAGGGQPRWRKDGRELYYRAPDGDVMAVDIKTAPKLEAAVPRTLFRSPSTIPVALDPVRHQLAVTPDGQRFLLRFGQAGFGGLGAGVNSAVPEAQPFSSGFGGGSVRRASAVAGPGGGVITTGLTVMQHWTVALRKGEK